MNRLIIGRGIPGSGKSTAVKVLQSEIGGIILSTDEIVSSTYRFKDGEGNWCEKNIYLWNSDMVKESHYVNKMKCHTAMSKGISPIFIDNTNITFNEIEPYVLMAKNFGYQVEYILPNSSWKDNPEECFVKNTHNVPLEVIKRMAAKFENQELVDLKTKNILKVANNIIEFDSNDFNIAAHM